MKAEPLKAKLTTKLRMCADAALTDTHLSNVVFIVTTPPTHTNAYSNILLLH